MLVIGHRTPLIHDEEQPSDSVQVLSNGTLQLRDVTSRDLSAFTCVVALQNDPWLAVAETFTITLQGRRTAGDSFTDFSKTTLRVAEVRC